MTCFQSNSDSNEKLLSCSCGNTIHFKCLHKATIVSSHWSNSTPPKYIIDIFNSPYFKLYCKNCTISTSDISNTTTDSHLLNDIHNNVLINTNLINAIKLQVSDLITNAPSKSYASVLSANVDNINKSINIINNNVNHRYLTINEYNTIIFENLPTIKTYCLTLTIYNISIKLSLLTMIYH